MKRFEWVFNVTAFMLQCGAIVPMMLRTGNDSPDLGASNPLNTISTASVLAVTLLLLLRHGRVAFRCLPRMWPIVALTLLALCSISWSDYPDITLRRSVSLLTAALWAWYVTARYDLKDVVAIARQATGLMAVASLVIAVAAPAIGGEDPAGPEGLRGIFSTKNDLGMVMAIGTITYSIRSWRIVRDSGLSCCSSWGSRPASCFSISPGPAPAGRSAHSASSSA